MLSRGSHPSSISVHDSPIKRKLGRDQRIQLAAAAMRFLKPTLAIIVFCVFFAVNVYIGYSLATSDYFDNTISTDQSSRETAIPDTKLSEADDYLLDFISESEFRRDRVRDILVREGVLPTDRISKADHDLVNFLSSKLERNRAREVLIKELVSTASPDTDPGILLDSALDVIDISEWDAEPVQIHGFPFLFVGSVAAAMNTESLRKNNITHVINWSSSAKCNIDPNIKYFCVEGVRNGKYMMPQLIQSVEFIEKAHDEGGNILSHCWHGRNRSVTTLIAYLMKSKGFLPKKANGIILNTRSQAEPYRKPLLQYLQYLQKGSYKKSTGDNGPEFLEM